MRHRFQALSAAAIVAMLWSAVPAQAQGLLLPFGGSIHGNMAGTSTAVANDAVGALFWNPATMSGLQQNEVTIGPNLLFPHTGVTGTIPAGAFGPRNPLVTQSGRTNSDNGVIPTTALALVYRDECSRLTYGLGMASLAVGGVNFPGDANNPILAPTEPLNQFILGPQASSISVLSITPSVSYQLNDRIAFGGGPMIDVAAVSFDPAFFGPPSQANPLAPQQFPTGAHSRPFWGGGFRAGMTYKAAEHVTAGLSYTSPHWFETWEFNARDANGNAIQFRTPFSLPQIFSAGVAYDGIRNLLLAADLRWFDYSTTKLLGQQLVDGGANWSSIWAVSLGANYRVNDRLSVQAGYLYNENPVPANLAFFNTQLPAITTNTLTIGAAYQLNPSIGTSIGYARGFENTVSGSALQALGTNTTLDSRYDAIIIGINIKFGGPHCRDAGSCCDTGSCSPLQREGYRAPMMGDVATPPSQLPMAQ